MKVTNLNAAIDSFKKEIKQLTDQELKPARRLRSTIPMILGTLKKLKEIVLQEGFASEIEEIHFFKVIKPEVKAALIYEIEFYKLAMDKPAGTKVMLASYYTEQLQQVQKVFKDYPFQYQYYKSESQDMDGISFTRAEEVYPTIIYRDPDTDTDSNFATAMDFLFAKFMAAERLQAFLLDQLTQQEDARSEGNASLSAGHGMTWTGEGINLVEIAYGIWLTGQVNHGNANLSEIIEILEAGFNVKLGRPYRRWTEISRRKQISTTKFLDQMVQQINKRIDDEAAIKSDKRRSNRN